MHVSSVPSQGSAVVIACATADVDLIAKVADRLRERDYTVEMLGGAEADELALVAAVQRVGRNGLYVLVRSDELGRAAVDSLRSHLRHHDVSFGRILTLTLEGVTSPSVLEERILSVMQRLSTWNKSVSPVPLASMKGSSPPPPPGNKKTLTGLGSVAESRFTTRDEGDEHEHDPSGHLEEDDGDEDDEDVERWAESLAGPLVMATLETEPSGTTAIEPVTAKPHVPLALATSFELDLDDELDELDTAPVDAPMSMDPAAASSLAPRTMSSSRSALRPPVPPPLKPARAAEGGPKSTASTPAPSGARSPTPTDEVALADTLAADLLDIPALDGSAAPDERRGLAAVARPNAAETAVASSASALAVSHSESSHGAAAPSEGPAEGVVVKRTEGHAASAGTELPAWLDESVVRSPPPRPASSSETPVASPPRQVPLPSSAARPLVPQDGSESYTTRSTLLADELGDETDPATATFGTWGAGSRWRPVLDVWLGRVRTLAEQAKTTVVEAAPEHPRALLERQWWVEHKRVAGSAAAALVLVVAGFSLMLGGDDESDGEIATASVASPSSKDSPAASEPAPSEVEPEPSRVEASATSRIEAPATSRVEAPATSRVEAPATSRVEAPATARVEAPAQGTAVAEGRAPAVPTPIRSQDATRIADALEHRKVRAMDSLLVSAAPKKGLSFSAAHRYCGGLEVSGISGWRLPEIGELHSLAQAKIIGRSDYWSATSGDVYGDRMMTLDSKRREIHPTAIQSSGVATVCVRSRG